jgi:hypothetical protein
MTMIDRNSLRVFAVGCTLLAGVAAQDEKPKPTPEKDEPVGVREWPEASDAEEKRIVGLVRALVDDEEDRRIESEAELIALGPRVGKPLLHAITPRKPELHEPIFRVLDAVTDATFTPLLIEETENRKAEVRRWAVARLATLHAEAAHDALEAAFERGTEEKDVEMRFRAALGLCGLGDWQHYDVVLARVAADFPAVADRVSEILTPQRGAEAQKVVFEHLEAKDETSLVASLRVMRSVLPKDAAWVVAPYLDASAALVKKEAINTLRVVVDGDAPLETLSAFQAIGEAKKWKERL